CKGLDAYENPERMANVQAAKKMIQMGYNFIPGMKISWIVTDAKSTPQQVEPFISGVPFTATPDYKYYAERLAQMAGRITEVYGWAEDDLLRGSQQTTLFSDSFSAQRPAPKPAESKPVEKKPAPGEPKPKKKVSLDDFF
ncbi:MAG: DNA polymerase II, partial [Candidatus Methanomethylophilus sp.]|nr:DNA polymerase II [Methanomethylophilus sp.]